MNRLRALIAVAVAAAGLALAPGAQAGTWIQVSCVNPNGSAAPNSGWTGFSADAGPYDYTNIQCGPGTPLVAALGDQAPDPGLDSEFLGYTPPSGSTLVGGTVDANLYADGVSASGGGAAGVVALFEPELANSPSDYFFQCGAHHFNDCPPGSGSSDYSGLIQLPANRGGNFTAQAGCRGASGDTCATNAPHGAWAWPRSCGPTSCWPATPPRRGRTSAAALCSETPAAPLIWCSPPPIPAGRGSTR